jgi:uncharacterized protein YkwD
LRRAPIVVARIALRLRRALTKHHPLTRVAAAAIVLSLIALTAHQGPSQAILQPAATNPPSILPTNIGIGVASTAPVTINFPHAMDAASVARSLLILPDAPANLAWSQDGRRAGLKPTSRWQTDQRYLVIVGAGAKQSDGTMLNTALRYSFTTQTAPTITEFDVNRAGVNAAEQPLSLVQVADGAKQAPADTAQRTSAATSISIRFSAAMNQQEVEAGFMISPTVAGALSWDGTTMTFTPSKRFDPSTRYAVAILGGHDLQGNQLRGDVTFSFTVASRATVVKMSPAAGSRDVTGRAVTVWFSEAVDPTATARAFSLVDVTAKHSIAGKLTWDVSNRRLAFTPRGALPAGHRFEVRIGSGAADADGNLLSATFGFTTKAPAQPARAAAPSWVAPAPSGSAQNYALSLINAARSAYGFAPLRLDTGLNGTAQAHSVDMARYGYFSHNSRDGSSFRDRFTAAGISWSHAGENICMNSGSVTGAIAACHSIMMAEPYPGYWNHIANILNPNFTRVGFGYARRSDGELLMTWDFAG